MVCYRSRSISDIMFRGIKAKRLSLCLYWEGGSFQKVTKLSFLTMQSFSRITTQIVEHTTWFSFEMHGLSILGTL